MLNKDQYNEDEYNDYYAQEVRGAEISDVEEEGSGKKIMLILLLLLLIIAVGYFGWKNMNISNLTNDGISKGEIASVKKETKVHETSTTEKETVPMPEQSKEVTSSELLETTVSEPEQSVETSSVESSTDADTIANAVENIASSKNSDEKMSSEDIASIVQMVMMKMNKEKKDEPKNTTGTASSEGEQEDTSLVASLSGAEVDSLSSITDKKGSTLAKDTDTYNKVVLKSSDSSSDGLDDLSKLSAELSDVIDSTDTKSNSDSNDSSYTDSIAKEVKTREKEMRYIVVKQGDTLGRIAKRVYGDAKDYKKIYDANPDVLRRPDKIYIGQKLRIP